MSPAIDGSRIDDVLAEAVRSGAVPHVAAIAADRDGIIYEGGSGPRQLGSTGDVDTSTQFRIMSMTKMVTTAVALQQMEQGALDLDAPVEDYCPDFAQIQVLDGFDGDTPRLRAPATRATVRQLVTHTAGFGYYFWSEQLVRYEAVTGTPNVVPGKLAALQAPLLSDPGTTYTYGINTDWLGRVVEAASGRSLDVAVKEGVTGPLGMDHTAFLLDEPAKDNAVGVHLPADGGGWTNAGEILSQAPEWWAGGHGLYSTPRDYVRFERALLRGGELDGTRILSAETVDAAFSNQIGDLDFPAEIETAHPATTAAFRPGPGWKWGYGLLLNTQDVPGGRRAGSGAWAGLFNTHFWIDRSTGVCASIYTNSLPFITPEAMAVYGAFEQALYAEL